MEQAQDVFNLLQNFPELILIIDLREPESFAVGHMPKSLNLPCRDIPGDSSPDDLYRLMQGNKSLFLQRRRLYTVIFYGSEQESFASKIEKTLKEDKCKEVHTQDFRVFIAQYAFLSSIDFKTPRSAFPNEILPGKLYLGNQVQASDEFTVRQIGITHIVNATKQGRCTLDDVQYLHIDIEDHENEDITLHFKDCYQFVSSALDNCAHKVLIHCAKGVSRSVSLTIMFLMVSRHIDYDEAFGIVKRCREIALPNEGFVRQLKSFSKEIIY